MSDLGDNENSGDSSSIMGEGLQSMFLLNAFRSGEVNVEVILLMLIPILYRAINWDTIKGYLDWEQWKRWHEEQRRRWMHHRYIKYSFIRTHWGGNYSVDNDTQNSVLHKAIELYLHSKVQLDLKSANVNLSWANHDVGYGSDNEDDDDEEDKGWTMAGWLSKHRIMNKPMEGQWQQLGKFGTPPSPVELRIANCENQASSDGDTNSKKNTTLEITFHLASVDKKAIDAFIETAFKHYIQELKEHEAKESRYYYEITSLDKGGSDGDDSGNRNVFRRYKLSEEKTFESLFFQQKDVLLKLINNFENKSGKYGIKGYPHKMGVLLHGPPGTGKTSLIKALAQHTGRSIVNVPLAKISTNSQLTSIFFDKKFHLHDEDVPARLGFKDVIFVMEDVDAASNVVRRRADADIYGDEDDDEDQAELVAQENLIELPLGKSLWRMLLESSGRNDDCRELVKLLMEKSDRLKQEASKPEILQAIAQRMMILPGLGLVGENGSVEVGKSDDDDDEEENNGNKNDDSINIMSKIGEEAVKAATKLMEKYETVDRFLGTHANNIKAILETSGLNKLDDSFVDMMLQPPAASSLLGAAALPEASSVHELSKKQSQDSDSVDLSDALAVLNSRLADNYFEVEDMKDEGSKEQHKDSRGLDAGGGIGSLMGPMPQGGGSGKMGGGNLWGMSKLKKDVLNLTGILNVLDGVVDTPGRILIMTTNHPEMLDPALIRPGRIDQTIMLGYMSAIDVISMLEHYYPDECAIFMDTEYKQRVEAAVEGNIAQGIPPLKLTPAQIEQLTAQFLELEDMVQALEAKAAAGGSGRRKPSRKFR